ncbi:MAG: hypothetical protein ACYTAN_02775 [Planctomycetota bacterium]|jgi:hypothetical protein
MNQRSLIWISLWLFALSGCVTTTGRTAPASRDVKQIRGAADAFLQCAMHGRYDDISNLVVGEQSAGFNGEVFVANRFRMPVNRFEILGWDRLMIQVTSLKDGSGMLSTAVVTVRALATNEVKPLYVNLHWRKEGGAWRINPYPRQ